MKRFKYLTLAALVAFAACDEGTETVVVPPVTGTVSGSVMLEGSAASGVSVGLSSGATATTDGSGAYSFSGVTAGAYTVTISGFASDASFSSTVKAVTISTAGQVATANFDGSFIRTSAILGAVSGGGAGLSGVSVSLSGQSSSSTTTDGNGQFSFSGLRAGSYTVSMSNPNSSLYTFASTSTPVTLDVGASQVVSFSGSLLTTAVVKGSLFLDENAKNNSFDVGAEDKLAVAGITVALEQMVGDTIFTVTDANGDYMFTDLAEGQYKVIAPVATDPLIPGNVGFGEASMSKLIVVTAGGTGMVNWAYDILVQTVKVYSFLGTDAQVSTNPGPGHTALAGVTIDLYDTQANAAAHIATGSTAGRLNGATQTTNVGGEVIFRYTRTADASPAGSADDNIVFAVARSGTGTPPANMAINGELILEIKFDAKDSLIMANDSLDYLNGSVAFKFDATDVRGNALTGWNYRIFGAQSDTSAATTYSFGALGTGGTIAIADVANPTALPIKFYFDLAAAQAMANGHGFAQTPSAAGGVVQGSFVTYTYNGLKLTNDTVYVGRQTVNFTDADIVVRIHDEEDDTLGYTAGDALVGAPNVAVQLYTSTGASSQGPFGTFGATGEVIFTNRPTGATYTARARRISPWIDMLDDTIASITLDGAVQRDTINVYGGSAGFSTFMVKHSDGNLGGFVRAVDGSAANGIPVKIQACGIAVCAGTPDNIQPNRAKDTTVIAAVNGAYNITAMREGPYMISVLDSVTSAGDSVWAFLGTNSATHDLEGLADVEVRNFTATRMDTKVEGVVVNDRDSDYNTLDPFEALEGVTIDLIADVNGNGTINTGDNVIATTTTDVSGGYGFSKLREGTYIVRATSPVNATVLRALSVAGAVTNTAAVVTQATVGAAAPTALCLLANCINQNNTRQAGNMSPPAQNDEFPRWNYLTGAAAADGGNLPTPAAFVGPNSVNGALTTSPGNFVHLFNTGTVTGVIETNAGAGISGVRVTITRCQTLTAAGLYGGATAPPSPPAGLGTAVCVKHGLPSTHIQNVDTDAAGTYTFSNLLEGVYVVEVAPATAGYSTNEGPDSAAATGDETMVATLQGNNDIETVADFIIS